MSSKFFTNQDDNTLENRLKDILLNYNASFAEFLVGYFRISGFSKISSYLENIKKARVLVGIDLDKITFEAKQKGTKANLFDNNRLIDSFKDEQEDEIKKATYSKEVENSVEILIKMLQENRLELRISRDKNIHSKIYILRENPITKHDGTTDHRGSVITGSSNLSENGLSKNYEFNVELRDSDDIAFALEEFENLWQNSVEITSIDVANTKNNSYLKEISPYELYMRFLIEHFGDRMDFDPSAIGDLPSGLKKLTYQEDAVAEGLAKIRKHGGFFLSDVVGLGKTITTAMITQRLLEETKGEILIIAPPSIKKEWEETFDRFEIGRSRGYKFYSYGKLDRIREPQKYEIVIIDESHKFRNFATGKYRDLEKITKEHSKYKKKIILISATPLNNTPQDIANQLYLFQDMRKSTIDSQINLEKFFAEISREYKELIGTQSGKELDADQMQKLKELSAKVRDNILREVMVRRTRTDIESIDRYKNDLEAQGLKIPKINEVVELEYEMTPDQLQLYTDTLDILLDKYSYARYKFASFLTPQAQKKLGDLQEGFLEKSADGLSRIMKTLLVKRLESSFFAFRQTIKRQLDQLEFFIKMYESDKVLIANIKSFDVMSRYEEYEESFEELADELISSGKAREFVRNDFKEGYIDKLLEDRKILKELVELWQKIDGDPKLDRFKTILSNHPDERAVIFTESKATAEYLGKSLAQFDPLVVHGGNRGAQREAIRENFDANYTVQKNDHHLIITTDTLSEGVNMHRSNIIYNYDIPWNSTRLMQRIGRINRIGTPFDEIHIYNFKPTATGDEEIELSKKAHIKLQTFHHSLGEDSKIYTKDEEVGTVSLFEDIQDEKIDEELIFLEELRDLKEQNPQKYNEIKNLPNKARVQRKADQESYHTLVFVKNRGFKNYLLIQNGTTKTVSFVEMAKAMRADKDEKADTPLLDQHYADVNTAYEHFEREIAELSREQTRPKLHDKKDISASNFINDLRMRHIIDIELFKKLDKLIYDGKYQNISKELIGLKKEKSEKIASSINKLLSSYNIEDTEEDKIRFDKSEIILSESFKGA